MPDDEGRALYDAAIDSGPKGPIVEIGTYCGKSAVYLGAAAAEVGSVVFTVDHHRGSEEMQAGWEHHDDSLVGPSGEMNSLPTFRALMREADLDAHVVAVVGDSAVVGASWFVPAAMVFIDGGHGPIPANADYELWAPHVVLGGLLAIHDVFPNPDDGGRPPYEIFRRAIDSGEFVEVRAVGSLRILRRTHPAAES
ncbi:MAG: class I SAM-dependent methyltransferase [Actinomycetota bacterium]|nr:class I SAM-dependent methyltransferase [Actinomycetota bacterium]